MMRKPPDLKTVTEDEATCPGRRTFCAAAVALIGLSACGGDAERISVGGLDGGSSDDLAHSGGPGDAAQSGGPVDLAGDPDPVDLATSGTTPDMAQTGSTCSGTVAGGLASAVTASSPHYISSKKIWVCRDSGGLYAMSSSCTHQGTKVTLTSTGWYCNSHGATFDLNGQHPTSPANSPLKHYAMCVDGTGTVQVDTNTVVTYTTRS